MKCPACETDMSQLTVAEVEVDVCKGGCGGVWFDNYELRKLDKSRDQIGSELLDVDVNPDVKVDLDKERNCPRCENFVLMRHFFSVKKAVAIDECAGCGGIWFDAGELNTVKGLFSSAEERKAVASQAFDEMFGSELSELKAIKKLDSEKAKRIANMVKYICPSNYIKDKKDWEEF